MTDMNAQVKALIETQILAQLRSTPEVIEDLIKSALSKGVDPTTGRSDGFGNKVSYLDFIVGETIRDFARGAVLRVMQEELREKIETAIRKKLTEDDVVKAVTQAFIGTVGDDWRISVNFARER